MKTNLKTVFNEKIYAIISEAKHDSKILPELRRGVGRKLEEYPKMYKYIFSDIPDECINANSMNLEKALYGGLTLFALHQQGKDLDTALMHKAGFGNDFATAIAKLAGTKDSPYVRRFDRLVASQTYDQLLYQLRSMIQILRSNNIPIDYVDLMFDLLKFQKLDGAAEVRLKWDKNFYITIR